MERVKNATAIAMKTMSGLYLPSHVISFPVISLLMGRITHFLSPTYNSFLPQSLGPPGTRKSSKRQLLSNLSVPLIIPTLRKKRDVRSHSWVYLIPIFWAWSLSPAELVPWGWQQTPSRSLLFAECIHQEIIVLGQVAALSLCWKHKPSNPLLHSRGILCLAKQTLL